MIVSLLMKIPDTYPNSVYKSQFIYIKTNSRLFQENTYFSRLFRNTLGVSIDIKTVSPCITDKRDSHPICHLDG